MQPASKHNLTFGNQQKDGYWSVVSDLVSLIERTRTQEQIAGPATQIRETSNISVEVLDNRAPIASGAWSDCNKRLREALHFLLEARPSCVSSRCLNEKQSGA
jgi:hypothetical protein